MSSHIPKLHKINEFGHGSTVLAISSTSIFDSNPHIEFINRLKGNYKVFLHTLEIHDRDDNKHSFTTLFISLVNTLNKYHFAKTIIIDYPVFILLSAQLHKLQFIQEGKSHLILFNPSLSKSYETLFNEKINFDIELNNLHDQTKNIPKEIKLPRVDIFAKQDPKFSLKLASQIQNSKLHNYEDYFETIDQIIEISGTQEISN